MYASFEEAATLGERFWVRCAAAGAATAGQIVFVSDGAPWIHTLQRAYLPGAVVVLEPWRWAGRMRWAWGASGGLVGRCLADAWQGGCAESAPRVAGPAGARAGCGPVHPRSGSDRVCRRE